MENTELNGAFYRLTLATSKTTYSKQDKIVCLKEFFEDLSKDSENISIEDVDTIIDFVHESVSKYFS
jgi:hypothetical protein